MARTYNLDADFLNRYLEIDKTINSDVVFEHYPRSSKKTPAGFYQWQSTYILSGNDTVNNLFLTLKTMRNIDYEYNSFMLSYREHRMQNIICQLEVYPDDVISHREPDGAQVYGPHMHYIESAEEVRPPNYNNFTWYDWLEYYTKAVNIEITGQCTAAFDGELNL